MRRHCLLLLLSLLRVATCVTSTDNDTEYLKLSDNRQERYLFEADIILTKAEMRLLLLLQRKAPGNADWHRMAPDGTDRAVGDGDSGGHDERLDSDIVEEGFLPLNDVTSSPHEKRKKRAATSIKSKLWPNATIPYVIGASITVTVKENIEQAINHWQTHTCIQFVRRTVEENFLLFESGPCGCCSYVGRKGTEVQEVTLSPHCASYGVVIHELGHAIGFWHEHSRPDRDQFIHILRQNVVPEKLDNFDKKSALEIETLNEPYDYESIMHYRKKTFSRNGQDTILPTKEGVKIGQRRGLSPGDIAQTRLLYSCPKPRCHEEFTSSESSFTSPNYPQKYFRDYECSWVITVLQGEVVTLEFIDFALERSPNCTFDYIEIREGRDGMGNLIGRMCGEGVPGTFQVSNSVWINFVSDSEDNFRGFWAHYLKTATSIEIGSGESDESGDFPVWRAGAQPTYMANCNQHLRDLSGSVSSPLMPIMYAGQPIECSWTIDGGVNASRIQLTIIDTPNNSAEQCLGDVYKMTSGKRMQAKQRTEKKPNKRRIEKREQDISNHIDNYKTTSVQYNCRQSKSLMLASHSVTIQWSSENNQPISFSYVIDYDECLLKISKCEHKCENSMTSFSCSCYPGYYLSKDERTCIAKALPPVADKCGALLTAERGIISVSNWTNLRECGWMIQPPGDLRVFLTFAKFFIPSGISPQPCLDNYVEIRVGQKQDSRVKYCDRKVPPALNLPSGGVMVRLRNRFHRAGVQPQFTASFLVYKKYPDVPEDCQQKIKGHGEIVYPEFRKNYLPYTFCTWQVSAKQGNRLRLHFLEMDIEVTQGCHFDYVQVRSGHLATATVKGQFCGQSLPPDVVTGTKMLIIFVSDGSLSGRGFKALVTSERRRPKLDKTKKKAKAP